MARITCIAFLVVMLNLVVGCNESNTGKGQIISPVAKSVMAAELETAGADEIDLVEDMASHRKAYRQALDTLVTHYEEMGNHMKLQWAQKELQAFDESPQYRYIIEAAVAGPDLRAAATIPEADELYNEAEELYKEAKKLLVLKDKDLVYLALDRYNQVFRKYPTSDKIDDAVFQAGVIYEYFKDWSIAAMCYQRAYQWDPATPHIARYKRAYILDNKLGNKAEALVLYQEALEKEVVEGRYQSWKVYAQRRVAELTKTAMPNTAP